MKQRKALFYQKEMQKMSHRESSPMTLKMKRRGLSPSFQGGQQRMKPQQPISENSVNPRDL